VGALSSEAKDFPCGAGRMKEAKKSPFGNGQKGRIRFGSSLGWEIIII
jgi:hypothetical protein